MKAGSGTAAAPALEDFSHIYLHAVKSLLAGDGEKACVVLSTIPGQIVSTEIAKRNLSPDRQLQVFLRDGFQCSYCSRKTVFVPVLRILATHFPKEFPYHPHGKMAACHVAFWRDIASCDHLVPVARGGSSEMENLVTACYMCNSIKQNWLLEELRWEQSSAQDATWDGLTSSYMQLLALMPPPLPSYHVTWSRALKRAVKDRT